MTQIIKPYIISSIKSILYEQQIIKELEKDKDLLILKIREATIRITDHKIKLSKDMKDLSIIRVQLNPNDVMEICKSEAGEISIQHIYVHINQIET